MQTNSATRTATRTAAVASSGSRRLTRASIGASPKPERERNHGCEQRERDADDSDRICALPPCGGGLPQLSNNKEWVRGSLRVSLMRSSPLTRLSVVRLRAALPREG